MPQVLALIDTDAPTSAAEVKREILARNGNVLHSYGPRVLIFEGDADLLRSIGERPGTSVYAGPVEGDLSHLDETGRMGIDAWNAALSPSFREAKRQRKGEGSSWDTGKD